MDIIENAELSVQEHAESEDEVLPGHDPWTGAE
jgi:hypothetical protein